MYDDLKSGNSDPGLDDSSDKDSPLSDNFSARLGKTNRTVQLSSYKSRQKQPTKKTKKSTST